jgi:hypothetical protein
MRVRTQSLEGFDLSQILNLKCYHVLLTFSMLSKYDFMHLMATFYRVFTDSAFNTSENVPSPSFRYTRYSSSNQVSWDTYSALGKNKLTK